MHDELFLPDEIKNLDGLPSAFIEIDYQGDCQIFIRKIHYCGIDLDTHQLYDLFVDTRSRPRKCTRHDVALVIWGAEESETINERISLLLESILNREFNSKIYRMLPADLRYDIARKIFFKFPEDEKTNAYLMKIFLRYFKQFLIDKNDTETAYPLLHSPASRFITRRNVDKLIQYAIEKKRLKYKQC